MRYMRRNDVLTIKTLFKDSHTCVCVCRRSREWHLQVAAATAPTIIAQTTPPCRPTRRSFHYASICQRNRNSTRQAERERERERKGRAWLRAVSRDRESALNALYKCICCCCCCCGDECNKKSRANQVFLPNFCLHVAAPLCPAFT